MTSLIERLIFGTAHLYGGPYTRQSLTLLDVVGRAGVTRFDTAPLYGMGSAEAVLGKAFAHDRDVSITTKVGLARPTKPQLRVWARKGLRLVKGEHHKEYQPLAQAPGTGPEITGTFDLEFMARSFEESATLLQREPEIVLLHECPRMPTDVTRQFLQGLRDRGRVGQVGYANGAAFDPVFDAQIPAGWQAQAAVTNTLLRAPLSLPDRPLVLHSLIGMGAWLHQSDPAYAAALDRVRRQFASLVPAAQWPAVLPYCLAATHAPYAQLIYATAQAERATAFLSALTAIDRAQALPALVATARSTDADADTA